MLDASEVGNYGTIRLMKRLEPDVAIASFPIDDEVVTFGRDPDCSVRLYYSWVSALHCKIVFEDRKAFLQVIGANGLTVDGCTVFPTKSGASNAPTPTTVPLINGSTFEIHKKRFQFSYPPKELRPQLFTPQKKARRSSLRMSMIHSAKVFSPRPSPNPRENLRILQSPLTPFKRARPGIAIGTGVPTEDEVVKLVDGNHPRVLEADQDLVILEDVEPKSVPLPAPSQPAHATPTPVRAQKSPTNIPHIDLQVLPKTPRRKSQPSLHRAVLIRSAQRAVQMQEMQAFRTQDVRRVDDDAREEEEVEEAVSAMMQADEYEGEDEADEEEVIDREEERDEDEDMQNGDTEAGEKQPEDMLDVDEDEEESENQSEDMGDGDEDKEVNDLQLHAEMSGTHEATEPPEDMDEDHQRSVENTPRRAMRTPYLGAFMTPQPRAFPSRNVTAETATNVRTGPQRPPAGRFSLGAGLATPSWKVKDILEMEKNGQSSPEEIRIERPTSPVKHELTEEEKNAIRERRKSELPVADFTHVPGTRRTSVLPGPPQPDSPFKSIRKGLEEGEDTRSMLQRMRQGVDGMRRKSAAGLLGLNLGAVVGTPTRTGGSVDGSSAGESGFSLLSPAARRLESGMGRKSLGSLVSRGKGFREEDVVMEETGSQLRREEAAGGMDVDHAITEQPRLGTPTPKSASNPSQRHVPATPRMDGVRELFSLPNAPPTTPSFAGVREMFRERRQARTPATPLYEGVGEMMALGEGAEDTVEEGGEDTENAQGDEGGGIAQETHDAETADVPRSVRRKGGRQTGGRTRRTAGSAMTDVSTMADDENTSADMSHLAATPASRRRGAASRAVHVDEAIPEDEVVPNIAGKAAVNRAWKKKALEESEDEMNLNAAEPLMKPLSRRARSTRSASREPSELPSSAPNAIAPPKATKATRRSRARTESTETELAADEDEAVLPTKPARRTTKKARAVEAATGQTVTKAAAKPPSRGARARASSREIETEPQEYSNDDPIDSFNRASSTEDLAPAHAKARWGRAPVETILEEKEPVKKTKSRSTKVQVQEVQMEDDETPAPVKKPASRRVKTATSRTAVQGALGDDAKENTPASDSTSPVDEGKPASRTKTARSRTRTTKEDVSIDAGTVPVKASRSRARK